MSVTDTCVHLHARTDAIESVVHTPGISPTGTREPAPQDPVRRFCVRGHKARVVCCGQKPETKPVPWEGEAGSGRCVPRSRGSPWPALAGKRRGGRWGEGTGFAQDEGPRRPAQPVWCSVCSHSRRPV